MENAPSAAPPAASRVYARLHVWSLSLASALTTLLLGLIAWPIHAMMMARAAARYGMYTGPWRGMAGPHAPMMHPALGSWHLLGLVIVLIWAGIAAAILAALYNAFIPKR
jgi:hypothetical protein